MRDAGSTKGRRTACPQHMPATREMVPRRRPRRLTHRRHACKLQEKKNPRWPMKGCSLQPRGGDELMNRSRLSAALMGAAFMVAGATVAPAQETLKIGGIGPLSGGGTAWGLAAQRGMEIAIEEINAGGGFKS